MLKALTAVILVLGIALAIVGAVGGGLAFIIVGDILLVGGAIMYLVAIKAGGPTVRPPG